MTRFLASSIFLLFVCFAGCSPQDSESTHQFRQYRENGIQIAETTGGPRYRTELFEYEVELIIPPGTTEETAIGFPRQFYADSDGHLYIVDETRAAVLVYSSDGQYLQTIGRKGFGPGELQHPRVRDVSNEVVSLFDLNTRRLSQYSNTGRFLDSFLAPAVPGVQSRSWNLRDYRIEVDRQQLLVIRQQYPGTSREMSRVITLFLSSSGDSIAEVGTDWIEAEYIPAAIGANPPPPLGRPYPYGPQPTCTISNELGVVVCDGIEPILYIYNFQAELIRKIEIMQEPLFVSSEMKQIIRQTVLEQAQSSEGFFETYWTEYSASLQFPETMAFSADIEVEDNGYIWVKVPKYPTAIAEHLDTTWRVISPEGEYLGNTSRPEDNLRNPPGSWRKLFNGRLLIIHEDEETGEWLPTVYRIQPIPRGLSYPN